MQCYYCTSSVNIDDGREFQSGAVRGNMQQEKCCNLKCGEWLVIIMSDKTDLKAELERKKQRLAQIREEKRRKEEERKLKEAEMKRETVFDESDLERKRRETEALLHSIGIPPEPPLDDHWTDHYSHPLRVVTWDTCLFHYLVPPPMSPTSSKSLSTPSEAGSQDFGEVPPGVRTLQWDTDPAALQLHTDSELSRRAVKLSMTKVSHVDLPAREMVSYAKETQTPVTAQQTDEVNEEDDDIIQPKPAVDADVEKQEGKESGEDVHPCELTEEEKEQVLHSDDFLNFFDRTSRIMERALAEHQDIFFDYSGRDNEEMDGEVSAGAKLSLNRQFYDERWSKRRVITSLDWSAQYPELLVATYNNNEDSPHEPDGVALVWNTKFKKTTPEYVFHCQSAVMSASFARFHPNLVVGGTYSGQIVLWDNRSNRMTPVQRTPLSAAAHTHPVYCVNVVGTQNAHNLISVSTDGRMCSWSLDMLSQPQDSMELVHKQSKSIAVTCMTFPVGDVNNFVVGSEEGSVYTACRHGSKAGISEVFEGHQGPVTGIHSHSAAGPIDFSHLFLTSSFDWTIKLWTTKNNKPLYSFEDNSDYVYDVTWSPVHPSLFASVDGMGRLDLWNLNSDTEVPAASVTIDGCPALNRVRWTHSGRELAVGDSEGHLWIYEIGEQLALPRNDEWTSFARTLVEIRANRADAEEESSRI
ncbi:cytoplasmic dynein 1 intermediate chain 1-like isoform X5 [Lethenteron reissneri]|uniref:cytoplasmic dynein 1 intermediate chain 1-like isoform X5 n=1 Tax=Lethenteron reissneri TaxID=7753 RepID=UPI002AB77C33|nr:cytoplasmic dynein 1 intermediate chain 1-like isoform X5 [Lethenteron reissneri]